MTPPDDTLKKLDEIEARIEPRTNIGLTEDEKDWLLSTLREQLAVNQMLKDGLLKAIHHMNTCNSEDHTFLDIFEKVRNLHKTDSTQQLTEVTKREAISLDCAGAVSNGDTSNGAEPFPKVITVKGQQYRHRSELDRWMESNACQARQISILHSALKAIELLSGHNSYTFHKIANGALADRLAEYEAGKKALPDLAKIEGGE